MGLNYFLLTIILISLSFISNYEFKDYYRKKTLDEIRHIILSLERFLNQYATFDSKLFKLNQMNRNELTEYTSQLIDQYGQSHLPSIDIFELNVIIYPFKFTVDDILKQSEKHHLVIWAYNSEKYNRKKEKQSDQIGGINEYAHLLSENKLITYINAIIQKHNELKDRSLFDKEILNIRYEIPSIIELLRESSLQQLKAYYYQIGIYLKAKTDRDDGIDHELLLKDMDDSSETDKTLLGKKIYEIINQNEELKQYDSFYDYIINKNISYTFPETIVNHLSVLDDSSIYQFVQIIEDYHSHYSNKLPQSLRNITDYIHNIPKRKLLRYILKEMKEYPELTKNNFKEEYKKNKLLNKLNQFSNNLFNKSRSELIQIYLNFQYVLNNTNRYNDNLGIIFRKKNFELIAMIDELSNSGGPLEKYHLIEQINSIANESLMSFIKRHPQIALNYWFSALLKYRMEKNALVSEKNKPLLNPQELYQSIIDICKLYDISSIEHFCKEIDKGKYSPLYGGLFAYLKVINIKVLLNWLRKLEEYHRSNNNIINIQGGYNYHHINLTKIDVINMIMTYQTIYPRLSNPIAFDQFTDSRFIKYYDYYEDIASLIDFAIILDGYRRRLNPQFVYDKPLSEYIKEIDLVSQKQKIADDIMFFIFSMFTFYPQLNNLEVLTRVRYEVNHFNSLSDYLSHQTINKLIEYCQQMQKYTNLMYNLTKSEDFSSQKAVSLILYLTNIYNSDKQLKKQSNLLRLLNNQNDYLYWNIDSYLNRQNKIALSRIINSIDEKYNPAHQEKDYTTEHYSVLKQIIISKINKYPELNNYNSFDNVIDNISVNDITIDLYNKLKECNRNTLALLALTTEFIYARNDRIYMYSLISADIYTVTNKELIKYILYGREDKDLSQDFTYNQLLLKSNTFYVNFGEDDWANILK